MRIVLSLIVSLAVYFFVYGMLILAYLIFVDWLHLMQWEVEPMKVFSNFVCVLFAVISGIIFFKENFKE
jgi:hypothetical protein